MVIVVTWHHSNWLRRSLKQMEKGKDYWVHYLKVKTQFTHFWWQYRHPAGTTKGRLDPETTRTSQWNSKFLCLGIPPFSPSSDPEGSFSCCCNFTCDSRWRSKPCSLSPRRKADRAAPVCRPHSENKLGGMISPEPAEPDCVALVVLIRILGQREALMWVTACQICDWTSTTAAHFFRWVNSRELKKARKTG